MKTHQPKFFGRFADNCQHVWDPNRWYIQQHLHQKRARPWKYERYLEHIALVSFLKSCYQTNPSLLARMTKSVTLQSNMTMSNDFPITCMATCEFPVILKLLFGVYPLVNHHVLIGKPTKKRAMFNSFLYVYQRVYPTISQYYPIIPLISL